MSRSSWSRIRSIHGFFYRLSSYLRFYASSTFSSSSCSDGYSTFRPASSNKGGFVYQNTLKCQRPATIPLDSIPHWNSVTFIGSLVFPVAKFRSERHDGVWTLLEVKSPGKSNTTFRVLIEMQGEMKEISEKHLTQNDTVYVAGHLDSYTKVDSSGRHMLYYKVIVKEMNFVRRNNLSQTFQKPESLNLNSVPVSDALDKEDDKDEDCLHLWSIFFASPHEWWDNRQKKRHPRIPDFRHKDTRECLWIAPNDPPWVTKQLQLLDSKMKERGKRELGSAQSRLSIWEYED